MNRGEITRGKLRGRSPRGNYRGSSPASLKQTHAKKLNNFEICVSIEIKLQAVKRSKSNLQMCFPIKIMSATGC